MVLFQGAREHPPDRRRPHGKRTMPAANRQWHRPKELLLCLASPVALTMAGMNTMSFPGFSSPAAGPEAPLDMLAACHTRVEKQCQTLLLSLIHI